MGKGTKHKCDWKPTTLEAVIAAMQLHAHTAKILGNPKVFKPENDFHNRTLLAAFETTLEIYRRCYEANDIHVVAKDAEDAKSVLDEIKQALVRVGLTAHPLKSRIVKAGDGVVFLGFLHRVLSDGKVLAVCDPKKVKANRRKLRRLTNKILRGETSPDALDESYQCIRAHMSKGNSSRLLRRMDEFFTQLKGEVQHGNAA